MSPAHLHILQHSLGCDQHGRQAEGYRPNRDDEFGCYRNRYVTSPECPDGLHCQQLVAQGFMIDHGPQTIAGGMHCYAVTQAGYDAMRDASPPPPKLSRSKRRWQAFRELSDLMDFQQYLTWPGRQAHEQRCGI